MPNLPGADTCFWRRRTADPSGLSRCQTVPTLFLSIRYARGALCGAVLTPRAVRRREPRQHILLFAPDSTGGLATFKRDPVCPGSRREQDRSGEPRRTRRGEGSCVGASSERGGCRRLGEPSWTGEEWEFPGDAERIRRGWGAEGRGWGGASAAEPDAASAADDATRQAAQRGGCVSEEREGVRSLRGDEAADGSDGAALQDVGGARARAGARRTHAARA
eukprot:497632-Rhodomonas_salina.3